MIWRRLLVRSDSTIANLHYTLQTAFGWSDEHLHRLHIHGQDYGVDRAGGILATFAELEADLVRTRTREGMAIARQGQAPGEAAETFGETAEGTAPHARHGKIFDQ